MFLADSLAPVQEAEPVLIVDDDEEVTTVLQEFLVGARHPVTVAHSVADARRCLRQAPTALVLLDLQLPDGDGLQLLEGWPDDSPVPDVIVVTGHATLDSAIAAVDAGAAGYVLKPIDLTRLGDLVGRVLEQRRSARNTAELQTEQARRARETEVLLQIAHALSSTREPTRVLEIVADGALALLGVARCALFELTTDAEMLEARITRGIALAHHLRSVRMGTGAVGTAALRREPYAIADVAVQDVPGYDESLEPGGPTLRELILVQYGAVLAVPLLSKTRLFGVLAIYWPGPHVADVREGRLLTALAQHAAVALENARLYAESQAREVEAAKLYAITRELATSLDVNRVLDLVIDKTIELLGCDAAALFRYDPARDGLSILRGRGQDPELTEKLVLRPGDGVTGRAFVEARPVWTADRLADPRVRYQKVEAASLVRAKAPRSYLAVPVLRRRGGVYGVLEGFFYSPHEFTEREIQMLSALADHAAIVIDNAELFERVQAQQIRLTQIFESTSDGILVADRAGVVTAANRRLAELFQIDADAIVGEDLVGLMRRATEVADGGDAVFRTLVADPDRGGEGDLEQRKARRVLHWVARPTRDATGATVGLTLTFRDVTDEREMARMKSDFVSFVTHQLRTPLAGIKWLLEVAARESGVPAGTGDYIRDAHESADRLVGLVNDLLDTSRLESGKLVVVPKPTDLVELTRSVLAEVEGLVRDRGHRMTITADAIPWIMVDPQLARQVVMNLVSNAIKYTLPGGEIHVSIVATDGGVQWTIQDNGIGIPQDGLRRLFEKFSRADNVMKLETEGTGLGLYLVRLIVERLGGRIWCESEEGKGSTFFVTLPLHTEEDHG